MKRIFKQDTNGGRNFKKLVYKDDEDDPFHYTIAEIYPPFKVGCPSHWALQEKLNEKKKGDCEENFEFFNKYYNK